MGRNIEPGDPRYEQLLAALKRGGGQTVQYAGETYAAIQDGDHIKFVPSRASTFETTYASKLDQPQVDVPFTPSQEPSETRAPKTPRKSKR